MWPILSIKYVSTCHLMHQCSDVAKTLETSNTQILPRQRQKYSAVLRKLCGHAAILPTSHTLTDGLKKSGEFAKAGGGFAEVWEGTYRGRKVAIKALRTYATDEVLKVKKVRLVVPLQT
jgi:hypothetical protein